jgi:hypothetical protein
VVGKRKVVYYRPDMDINVLKRKWWLTIIGTIFLGALGSGLWELAVKPPGTWISKAMYTVVTLGSHRLTDAIYREAARGHHEQASLDVLVILFAGIASLAFYISTNILSDLSVSDRSDEIRKAYHDTTLADFEEHTKQLKAQTALLRAEIRLIKRRSLRYVLGTCVMVMLMLVMLSFSCLRLQLASTLNQGFEQSMVFCQPYIDEHSALLLRSRYAGIQTKADYERIMQDLNRIAVANRLILPPS